MVCTALLFLTLVLPGGADEVEFVAGKDKIHGTLELPPHLEGRVPAVVLISGSGPTDRDGNNALLPGRVDSHRHLAELLAANGVASLRYDKVFTGKTGPASHTDPAEVGIEVYVDTADAAYRYLAGRPEIDPARMAILGHSEGGMIALIVAHSKKPVGLKGLILAMPMSEPYLKTTFDQISAQLEAAGASGNLPQDEAQAQIGYLKTVIEEIKTTGHSPTREKLLPPIQAVFSPVNDHFLQTCSVYDPAELAKGLEVPVLVLEGTRDVQITHSMIEHLMSGLAGKPQARLVTLKDTNHVLKVVPEGHEVDYGNPQWKFSAEADETILDWLSDHL